MGFVGRRGGRKREVPTATEKNEGENVYDALGGLKCQGERTRQKENG